MNSSATAVPPRVVMIAPSRWPDRGGVETHVAMVSAELKKLGWSVVLLVPPKLRPTGKVGLIWLWIWMLQQLPVLLSAQVIHIHDVFLWFWPVWPIIKLTGFLQPRSPKIITTFHGWEGTYPPTAWQRWNKWIAQQGSEATIAVGHYLSQFYPIQPAVVVYGGVAPVPKIAHQTRLKTSDYVYLGRLAADTGLPWFLTAVRNLKTSQHLTLIGEFWGDGSLLAECAEVGEVSGWVSEPLLALTQRQTQWVVASGYLSVLEALATAHQVLVIADNPLKQAYYAQAPFAAQVTMATSAAEVMAALQQPSLSTAKQHQHQLQAQIIQKDYSWATLAQQYMSVYDS